MLIKRIIAYKPSVEDVLSYCYIAVNNCFSGMLGTLIFRLKGSLFGVFIGKRMRCYGTVHLFRNPKSLIHIGNDVSIVSSSKRCTSSSLFAPTKLRTLSPTARIVIDDFVGLNGTSIVARSKTVRIGKGTIIAPNCVIMDSDFHAVWPPENRIMNPVFEKDADVLIGNNVWLGSQVMILKGVTIGDNSVICAGSVVSHDIPANVLAGGIPAKAIRSLS